MSDDEPQRAPFTSVVLPSTGAPKPDDFDEQVAYWRERARRAGRYCHCAHHDEGWMTEPYWERHR